MTGRYIPRDDDAEASILGGFMFRNELLHALPDLEVEDFRNPKHQAVFEAIRVLDSQGVPFDPVTIDAELKRQNRSESIGGLAFLGELACKVPSVENVMHYAATVVKHRVKFDTLVAVSEIESALVDPDRADELDGEAAHQFASSRLARVPTRAKSTSVAIGAVLDDLLRDLERMAEERARGARVLTGAPSGIPALDAHLGGIQYGVVTIVAGRPGMGKSAFGVGVADASSDAGIGAHIFSLEDAHARYAARTLARNSLVPPQDFAQANLTRAQLAAITQAVTHIRRRKGWILSTAEDPTADEIVREVRREADKNKTRVVVVDYVQMVKPSDRRAPRHEQLDEIITRFAQAAKNDGMAYVVKSQLNRKLEERPDKRPVMSDLKESGALEERPKCGILLYRGAVYGQPVKDRDYGERHDFFKSEPSWGAPDAPWERTIELIVDKNTSGATGTVYATWDGPLTMIS